MMVGPNTHLRPSHLFGRLAQQVVQCLATEHNRHVCLMEDLPAWATSGVYLGGIITEMRGGVLTGDICRGMADVCKKAKG